jgi:hypothetical protein
MMTMTSTNYLKYIFIFLIVAALCITTLILFFQITRQRENTGPHYIQTIGVEREVVFPTMTPPPNPTTMGDLDDMIERLDAVIPTQAANLVELESWLMEQGWVETINEEGN